ncbi:MAG: CRISPR system precrRNA processing endoribonuclease RAMP protein Cas6 [Casimicrobiaceae bacterium]
MPLPPQCFAFDILLPESSRPHPVDATMALRSAFGWTFRRQVCLTRAPSCEGCPLRSRCAYGRIFDPAPVEKPLHPSLTGRIPGFALRPAPMRQNGTDAAGTPNRQRFELILLAPMSDDLGLIRALLPRAVIGNRGFFGGAATLADLSLRALDRPTAALAGAPAAAAADAAEAAAETPPTEAPEATPKAQASLTLHCHTPLSIKQDNIELRSASALRAETLWRLGWRRLTQWCQLSDEPLPEAVTYRAAALRLRCDASRLSYERHTRKSMTQGGRSHPVDGFVGRIDLHGAAADIRLLRMLLAAVLPLQLGKDTVFGLGVCSLEDSPAAPEPAA